MKRIAILGCENSHADAFLTFIKEKEEFSDLKVVGIYSEEREAAERLNKEFGVPIMESFDAAVGNLDGLIITARHGDNHYKYAKPYIASGIPMFIDKPITISEDEAIEFMRELSENGCRISGGSSLRHDMFVKQLAEEHRTELTGKTVGGYVRAPFSIDSPYGGFYFYSEHLVDAVIEIFGRFPISVKTSKNGDQLHVLFHYEDYDVVGLYTKRHSYFASRMAEKGGNGAVIPFTNDWFYSELSEFCSLLSDGQKTVDYESFIAPVFIMNAIERSMKSGKEEYIKRACFI